MRDGLDTVLCFLYWCLSVYSIDWNLASRIDIWTRGIWFGVYDIKRGWPSLHLKTIAAVSILTLKVLITRGPVKSGKTCTSTLLPQNVLKILLVFVLRS